MMIPSQGSISIFYKNLLYALMKMRIIVFFLAQTFDFRVL